MVQNSYSARSILNLAGESWRISTRPFASLPMPTTVFGSTVNCFNWGSFAFQSNQWPAGSKLDASTMSAKTVSAFGKHGDQKDRTAAAAGFLQDLSR